MAELQTDNFFRGHGVLPRPVPAVPNPVPTVPNPAPAAPVPIPPAAPPPAEAAPAAPPTPDAAPWSSDKKSVGIKGDGDVKMGGRTWRSNVKLNNTDV